MGGQDARRRFEVRNWRTLRKVYVHEHEMGIDKRRPGMEHTRGKKGHDTRVHDYNDSNTQIRASSQTLRDT